MTEAKKATEGAAEPIIELVETIPLRYLAIAAIAGFAVSFVILYALSGRIRAESESAAE